MDNFQNSYLSNTWSQSVPERSARMGDPVGGIIGASAGQAIVAGYIPVHVHFNAIPTDNGAGVDYTNLEINLIAALTNWGASNISIGSNVDSDGYLPIEFDMAWNCANGSSIGVQNTVAQNMSDDIALADVTTGDIHFNFNSGFCPTIAPVSVPIIKAGGASVTPSPNSVTKPSSVQSWIDKNFFTGAGALTGVGIGAIVLIGAVVLSRQK